MQIRDEQLDIYRALSMIYVVCVIHVVYWLEIGQEPFQSFLLIEMPILFFISGAAQSIATKKKTYRSAIWNRIKRVLLPYYIYAIVLIGIMTFFTVLWYFIGYSSNVYLINKAQGVFGYNVFSYKLYDFYLVLSTQNIPQAHNMYHLWFIVPYLIISCTFVLQKKIISEIHPIIYIILCLLLLIIAQELTDNRIIRSVFCYNIFMVAGYAYYRKLSMMKISLICLISWIMLLLDMIIVGGGIFSNAKQQIPA